jgi:hypothetical protein
LRPAVLELGALLVVNRSHFLSGGSINLKACSISENAAEYVRQHFCANFLKVSNFPPQVKPIRD